MIIIGAGVARPRVVRSVIAWAVMPVAVVVVMTVALPPMLASAAFAAFTYRDERRLVEI
jgi:hypothetical protein